VTAAIGVPTTDTLAPAMGIAVVALTTFPEMGPLLSRGADSDADAHRERDQPDALCHEPSRPDTQW